MKKWLEVLAGLLNLGKTAAKDIQTSGDKNRAKRMREAVEAGDEEKFRRIMAKDFTLLEKSDIIGLCTTPEGPGVIFTIDAAVRFRQLFKDLQRCRKKNK